MVVVADQGGDVAQDVQCSLFVITNKHVDVFVYYKQTCTTKTNMYNDFEDI